MWPDHLLGLFWTTDRALRVTEVHCAAHPGHQPRSDGEARAVLAALLSTSLDGQTLNEMCVRALAGQLVDWEHDWPHLVLRIHVEPRRDDAGTTLGTMGFVIDATRRVRLEQSLERSAKAFARYQRVMVDLARHDQLGLDEAARRLLRADAETVGVERVSIWLLNETGTELFCKQLYVASQGLWTSEGPLVTADYPVYVHALYESRTLAVEDALRDPRTRELAEGYLRPRGITSMLDVGVWLEGHVAGIVCHEHVGPPRRWSPEDEAFASAMADMVALSLEAERRRRAQDGLVQAARQLEARVEARTAELGAMNRELEAFAYSVSHDLRAPLRSVDGFSQALLEDFAGGIPPRAEDYLRRVRAGAQHMGQLIDALLGLSRVGRVELRHEPVDLSAAAHSVVDELRAAEPARDVEVEIAEGLAACGDPTLLRVLLHNLLGNAWKYTGRRARARIEFGALRRDGRTQYFVRDNGAGFDMRYADRLFVPFQRLHEAHEFEGIGIGLPTVRRIVARHGGRVWAEAEVEKGATFWFELGDGGEPEVPGIA